MWDRDRRAIASLSRSGPTRLPPGRWLSSVGRRFARHRCGWRRRQIGHEQPHRGGWCVRACGPFAPSPGRGLPARGCCRTHSRRIVPSIICRRCSGVRRVAGVAVFAVERTSGPLGVTGNPKSSIQSWKSGGTHKRTSWSRAFSCNPSATNGWTSPHEPIVDNSTRIATLLLPQAPLLPADIFAAQQSPQFFTR